MGLRLGIQPYSGILQQPFSNRFRSFRVVGALYEPFYSVVEFIQMDKYNLLRSTKYLLAVERNLLYLRVH